MKTAGSAPVGVKSSLASTLKPWKTEDRVPHGPVRLGPMREARKAITFISMKMITKATGMVTSRIAVAVRMKRKMSMLLLTRSAPTLRAAGISPICQPAISAIVSTTSSTNNGRMILPARLSRFHGREITLI